VAPTRTKGPVGISGLILGNFFFNFFEFLYFQIFELFDSFHSNLMSNYTHPSILSTLNFSILSLLASKTTLATSCYCYAMNSINLYTLITYNFTFLNSK
jgi:hypothetical protein